jgi:hypothetical protein
MTVSQNQYDRNVFINCPFDARYTPLFEAIVFTVFNCHFRPLCALERMNSAQIRFDKIVEMIGSARYSIHDLSRTETDGPYSLPRFNMPLELGIALGCRRFGSGRQQNKSMLILDRRRYRYHRYISDIAGQDISEHRDQPSRAIRAVRDWLRAESDLEDIPGADHIAERYREFRRGLPQIARLGNLNHERLTFADYRWTISEWLRSEESR